MGLDEMGRHQSYIVLVDIGVNFQYDYFNIVIFCATAQSQQA